MTNDRDDIINAHPMLATAKSYGLEFKRTGGEWYAKCPFHGDGHASFRVNEGKNTWFCDPCGKGGSVIDFVMLKEGLDIAGAMAKLGGHSGQKRGNGNTQLVEVALYEYGDENGEMIYQVVRYVPKTFRQRHKNAAGEWVWNMEGVRRVPYHLFDLQTAEVVYVCEGEKDCDTLGTLGLVATCNVGGAKKWLDSYSDFLKDKKVIVIPDNDPPGKEHADLVIKSLVGKAKVVYRLELPAAHKDVTDFVTFHKKSALVELFKLVEVLKPVNPVPDLPVQSMPELEEDYIAFMKRVQASSLDLGCWLPSFSRYARPMVPGELVVVMADTGVGKTAILQNIAFNSKLPTLIFEMELPGTLMFERFVQIETKLTGAEVAQRYRSGTKPEWHMKHVYVCPQSVMDPVAMERIIRLAELKMGVRPVIVMVDYIGLLSSVGTSRYERVSNVAEQMKVLAKASQTVFIIASQVARPGGEKKTGEVFLHDAKDSGSIENSAGLVLGAWREGDATTLKVKILKNTKGHAGQVIECNYDGAKMLITEREKRFEPKICDADVPKNYKEN